MVAFSRGKREATEIRKRKEKGKESEGRAKDIGAHRVGMQRRRKQVSIFLFLSRLPSVSPRLQLHVLYSRVSMVFSLWYLLFRCPCPCLGTPSGIVSTRNLSLPLSFSFILSFSLEECLHHSLDDIFTERCSDARTYRWNVLHFHECIGGCSLWRRGRREALSRPKRRRRADREEGCYCKAMMTQQLSDKRETFKTILCFTFVQL